MQKLTHPTPTARQSYGLYPRQSCGSGQRHGFLLCNIVFLLRYHWQKFVKRKVLIFCQDFFRDWIQWDTNSHRATILCLTGDVLNSLIDHIGFRQLIQVSDTTTYQTLKHENITLYAKAGLWSRLVWYNWFLSLRIPIFRFHKFKREAWRPTRLRVHANGLQIPVGHFYTRFSPHFPHIWQETARPKCCQP